MEKKIMVMWTMIVVVGVLLAACLSANGATWEAMDCPTTESLRGVWGSAADNVFAAGTSGTILHYDVTGQWRLMNSPTSIQLNSIWGSSDYDIWVVGDNGTILRRQDGNDWQEISNIPSDLALNGVWGAGADDIYAVGQYTYGPGCILHWNGTSWTNEHGPIVGPLGPSMQFNAVWGRGPNEVYVVGHNGYSSGLEGVCYKYDGTGWSWEWSNTGWPKTRSFYSVWGPGNELFIAAEGYGGPSDWFAVTVHYNGTEWATKIFQDSLALMGVWGSAQDNVYMCSYSGMILHYDGVTWSNMDSGTTELLRGVWGADCADVFVVGDHGTILRLSEPADPIEEILDFIEDSVDEGALVPVKQGKPGQGQLGALINMVEAAGNLIDAELILDACWQLQDALAKTDGLEPPESAPDFVAGEAAEELASKIQELMTSLGCE